MVPGPRALSKESLREGSLGKGSRVPGSGSENFFKTYTGFPLLHFIMFQWGKDPKPGQIREWPLVPGPGALSKESLREGSLGKGSRGPGSGSENFFKKFTGFPLLHFIMFQWGKNPKPGQIRRWPLVSGPGALG